MKGTYARLNYFFQWLLSRSRDGKVIRPIQQAWENRFRMSQFRRALRTLEHLGKVAFRETEGGVIDSVEIVNDSPIVAKRTNRELKAENREVVLVVDIDNLLLRPEDLTGQTLHHDEVLRAIKGHAERLGKLIRGEVHMTIRTRDAFLIVNSCWDLNLTPVVVAPRPQASDDEMRKILELMLRLRTVKYFLIASNDSGFKGICSRIRESGREVQLITSAHSVYGLSASATKTVSVFTLLKEMKSRVNGNGSGKRKAIEMENRFSFPAVRLRDNINSFVPAGADEEFVRDCLRALEALIPRGSGMWRSFDLMVTNVWSRLGGWEERGYSYRECRMAISALKDKELLRTKEVIVAGGYQGEGLYLE